MNALKKTIKLTNHLVVMIILLVVYFFGIGITALLYQLVKLFKQKRKQNTFWKTSGQKDRKDYLLSPY